jgi:hypothetical protein
MYIVTPKLTVVPITDSNMLKDKRILSYPSFETEDAANSYIQTVIQTVRNMDKTLSKKTTKHVDKGPRISRSPTSMTRQQFDSLKRIVSEKSLLK